MSSPYNGKSPFSSSSRQSKPSQHQSHSHASASQTLYTVSRCFPTLMTIAIPISKMTSSSLTSPRRPPQPRIPEHGRQQEPTTMNTMKTTIRAVSVTAGIAALLYLRLELTSLVWIVRSAGYLVSDTIALVHELVVRWRLDSLYVSRERGGGRGAKGVADADTGSSFFSG
jgi:hypothetical protein